jgi:hypothetical protein
MIPATPANPARRMRVERADLVFTKLSEAEWSVSHRRFNRGDVRGLLGFVLLRAGVYEVTRVGRPHVRAYRSSLENAGEEFLRPHTFLGGLPLLIPDASEFAEGEYDADDLGVVKVD